MTSFVQDRDRAIPRDLPREIRRDLRELDIEDEDAYVVYERIVRPKHEDNSFKGFFRQHKFLIASVLLGLLLASAMGDMDHSSSYRGRSFLRRGMDDVSSWTDYIGDKIMHKPTMSERAYDAAYDAKYKMQGGLSYLGDRARDTVYDSHHKLRRAGNVAYGAARHLKNRAVESLPDYEDYVDEYVRRPTRRGFFWTCKDTIIHHPILSTLLGLFVALALKNMLKSNNTTSSTGYKTRRARNAAMSGLAMAMDKTGGALHALGSKVRANDFPSGRDYTTGSNQWSSDRDYRQSDYISHGPSASTYSTSSVPYSSGNTVIASTTDVTRGYNDAQSLNKIRNEQIKENVDAVHNKFEGNQAVLSGR